VIESRRGQHIPGQRARLTVRADQRRRPARFVQQVPNPAKVVDALLPQQRVHVGVGQAGPGQLASLDLALGDENSGRVVDRAGDPAAPPGQRDQAVHRRPTTATANIKTALATTQPRPPAPPMSWDMG
jgi:hypothetical protein